MCSSYIIFKPEVQMTFQNRSPPRQKAVCSPIPHTSAQGFPLPAAADVTCSAAPREGKLKPQGGQHRRVVDVRFEARDLAIVDCPNMHKGDLKFQMGRPSLSYGSADSYHVIPGVNQLLTMYYEQGGKLAMTHYCIMGNRPGMLLKSSDAKSLSFDFDPTCGINPTTESHMHALTISFDNPDSITTSCKAIINGKETDTHPTTLKRVKSS